MLIEEETSSWFCAQVMLLAVMRKQDGDFLPPDFQILLVILWHKLIGVKLSHFSVIKTRTIISKSQVWRVLEHTSISEQHLLVCVGYDVDQRFVKIYDVEHILSVSAQVQSTSWMPHQQYVMQPTVSTPASSVQRLPFKSHQDQTWFKTWVGWKLYISYNWG